MLPFKRLMASAAMLCAASFLPLCAQEDNVHKKSDTYIAPTDPQVLAKLDKWEDLKFGIILHWGVYSVPGIVESWSITSEDWITPPADKTYEEYKQWYFGLKDKFNPTKFNPEQWASVAKDAGMKYVVFTTKHHDGFCLWDSKQTDYTVTHSGFAGNPRADVAKYVFDAFRKEGMMAGCYFSKPDWHCPYYWWPAKATYNRMHNYDIKQYPERWQKYQSFVYNQVKELMSGYGPFDILWLDGGWCTAPREDIKLDSIVDMARSYQPGLIVVERACPGKNENYQTPERTIPEEQILNPWESCITLTHDWGYVKRPVFKTPARVIGILGEIVAKGGSLLLGVGPTPEGVLEDKAVSILEEVGRWMKANGEAIYATRPTPNYHNADKSVWFTANKDGKTLYAIVPKADDKDLPAYVEWSGNEPKKGSKVIDLASRKKLRWSTIDGVTRVYLPANSAKSDGVALRFETVRK